MTHRDSHTRGVTAIVVGLNPQPKDSRSDRSEQVRFFLSSLAAEGDSLSNNSGQNRTIPVAPELFAPNKRLLIGEPSSFQNPHSLVTQSDAQKTSY